MMVAKSVDKLGEPHEKTWDENLPKKEKNQVK